MQTDALKVLAADFAQRMSDLDWLTDALLLAGMYPSTGPDARVGQRTIEEHVILIGPTADRSRPFRPLHRSTRGDKDWIRVSRYMADVVDMDLFHDTLATQPRPTGDGKDLNILVVHYTRRAADGGLMRCFIAHHEEMDLPGASKKLADDTWVHNAFSLWLDDRHAVKPPQAPESAPERVEVHRALIESQRRYMRHKESPSVDLRQPVDLEPPPVVLPGPRRPRDPAPDRSAPRARPGPVRLDRGEGRRPPLARDGPRSPALVRVHDQPRVEHDRCARGCRA